MTRQTIPLLILAAVFSIGCRYGEVLAFGGGGKAVSEDSGGGSSSSGDDTSGPPPDDSGGPPMGEAPSILNVDAGIEDYPDIGWVVTLTITYTDPDNDVDGGVVELMAEFDGQEPLEAFAPIDGAQAIHNPDDGTVFLALTVSSSDVSGTLSIILTDSAGMSSEPYDQPL